MTQRSTQIRLRTTTVCRVGAFWMEFTYGGYMYVLMILAMPDTRTAVGTWPIANMGLLVHRTIMCECTSLARLILLHLLLLRVTVPR